MVGACAKIESARHVHVLCASRLQGNPFLWLMPLLYRIDVQQEQCP